ncbi:MAG: SRPBCC domain-containing protein [Casimicrobiaceae bacterium]
MRSTVHRVLGLLAGIAFAAAVFAQTAKPADVQDQSFLAADGTKVLQQSIVVPAGTAEVWNAFTTSEGFASWAAPVAAVDFRLGGSIESAYDPQGKIGAPGNIRNEIVAFVPQRMLAIRNTQAPPSTAFDTPTFQQLHTVIFLEPVTAATTLVTIVQPGFGKGEKYDGVYAFFARGNAWSLQQLAKRFAEGPKGSPKSP